ncbi:hypothetical protein P167DRAFT_551400 [Morchella conica CCBAS932]|uniref:Rab proteins geranylgeranyltransferase n=1 Tax=Morchella conica CCBAS932 TaxID=1392247 RepID=A0A3N4L4F3_9PEZI|nr:hypothetical protein P167DRAFT_551400 [Morchella conica CCBAS932]
MSFTDNPPLPSTDWDILITGSGIKQSLLAVALSRAGRTVLQIDHNAYYGGSSTAFYTHSDITTWTARVNAGHEAGFSHAELVGGVLGRGFTLSLAPDLVYWDSALLRMLRAADMAESFSWQAVGSWWVWLTDEEVAVPAAAAAAAAAGGGGGALLMDAGVKAAKAVAAGKKRWNKGRKKTAAAEEETVGEGEGAAVADPPPPLQEEGATTTLRKMGGFREVACTFEDVAWSKDLSDRDRGYLGEFLRFVMKHDSPDPADQKHRDIFTEYKTKPLTTLLTTLFPLPPSATTSLSSLSLLPTPPATTPLSTALPALARHFRSLGNIPDVRSAAALTVAYGGSAELCQVFSRAAAVAGGINVLGRGVSAVRPAEKEQEQGEEEAGGKQRRRRYKVALDNGEEIGVDWIIGSPSDLPSTPTPPSPAPQPTTTATEQPTALYRAAYILTADLPTLFQKKYADEAITPAAAVLMVPVAEEGGAAVPVYILARSWVTGECPRGHTLLYASTTHSYAAISTAVSRLLQSQEVPPGVLLSLFYTQTHVSPTNTGEDAEGVVYLAPEEPGVVFDDGAVEEARGVFGRIVGGGEEEGFMRLPENARRLLDEMEEA